MHIETRPTYLFPLWNYDNEGRNVGGPVCPLGFITNQNRMALPTWSYAMEMYPPARIVEIGAYNGGFTCALAIHAHNINAQVYSFDRQEIPGDKYRAIGAYLGICWYVMDCFSPEAVQIIKGLIQMPGVTYLLCDGGNKAEEMKTFGPMLKPGDVIGGHDYFIEPRHDWWGFSELRKEMVSGLVDECSLEPFMQEYFDVAAWLVYRRAKPKP